ncbi:MAG: hypothetical protein JOS17DRAFT_760999 [Linnemannia elongata]|nr:MAG: hypothetical protein JOS17DRAFT_760999 [Linnemannia elongata]
MIPTKALLLSATLATLYILSTTSAAPSPREPVSQSDVNDKCAKVEANISRLLTGYTCDTYINCFNGLGTVQKCPAGQVFYQSLQACGLDNIEGPCEGKGKQ